MKDLVGSYTVNSDSQNNMSATEPPMEWVYQMW